MIDDPRPRIRVEMARRQWTRLQLAEHSGISYVSLSRKMRGETLFDTDDLAAVATALDLPVAALFQESA